MLSFRDLLKITGLTIFFSVVIFIINYIFFSPEEISIEDLYLEPSIQSYTEQREYKNSDIADIIDKKNDNLNSASKYYFLFIPSAYKQDISSIADKINSILQVDIFLSKISDLKLEFYKDKLDVRGKMKSRAIKLFGAKEMGEEESSSVFIHEFGHFIDLYFLEKKVSIDLSNNFYNISWESTKTMRGQQDISDFVSGYAMTNKYEDFSESFTYYILHNADFLDKSKSSTNLKNKYNFFKSYIFKDNDFVNTNFGIGDEIKDYYWDITKIDINLDNFLQYLEKGI